MRNPIGSIVRLWRRPPEMGVDLSVSPAVAARGFGSREAVLYEAVEREITRARERIEAEQGRLQQEVASALKTLSEFAARAEITLLGRVEELGSEVARLREAMDQKLAAADERDRRIEGRVEEHAIELTGKAAELGADVRRLAEVFDRQLSSSERALESLREASERRVAELREGHRRQLASLERSRDEVLRVAQRSREQLLDKVEEVADRLVEEEWPAVPSEQPAAGPQAEGEAEGAGRLDAGKGPVSWIRAVLRRRRERGRQEAAVSSLRGRISDLEEVLRDRWEENVRRGRALRAALDAEREIFPPVEEDPVGLSRLLEGKDARGRRNGGSHADEGTDREGAGELRACTRPGPRHPAAPPRYLP
jgi:hypothetical protein